MNKIFLMVLLVIQLQSSILIAENSEVEENKADAKEAAIFAKGFLFDDDNVEIPTLGDKDLVENLSKITLVDSESEVYHDVKNVQLNDLVQIINSHIPPSSKWRVQVHDAAKDIRVSGTLDKHLLKSLVRLMKKKDGIYCRVVDGMVEFKRFEFHHEVRIKPEYAISVEKQLKGEAELFGVPIHSNSESKIRDVLISGNPSLVEMLESVELDVAKDIDIKDITLNELSKILNSKMLDDNKLKVLVADDSKILRVSGVLTKDLFGSLTRLMKLNENFHCRITNGVVELRKGGRWLNMVPLEPSISIVRVKDNKADPVEALIFGDGFWPNNELNLPVKGDMKLIEKLKKVVLVDSEGGVHYKVTEVPLKDLVQVINSQIPSGSKWQVVVIDAAKEVRVSGTVDKDLLQSLIRLMKKGDIYCRVVDGIVEIRNSDALRKPNSRKEHK